MEKRIEELKASTRNKLMAQEIERISKELGGPKPSSCFCTFSAANKYITEFFNWYDNVYKSATNE